MAEDIAEGDVFTESNLRIVRPGHGAPPWLLAELLGQVARRDYSVWYCSQSESVALKSSVKNSSHCLSVVSRSNPSMISERLLWCQVPD